MKQKTVIQLLVVLFIAMMFTKTDAIYTTKAKEEVKRVVVLKQLDHASLDEIASGIQEGILELGEGRFEVVVESGQNDPSIMKQIVEDEIQNEADVFVPIGTLAAQITVSSTNKHQLPVIYAAISDPQAAELTNIDYVSGTSDAIDVQKMIDLMLVQNPNMKKVGLLYSLSETNSTKAIETAKQLFNELGIELFEATANTNDEIASAVSLLTQDGVDCVFTPTDNVIMNHAVLVGDMFKKAHIPFYAGADSFVIKGAFATCGINYQDLAFDTSKLVIRALDDGIDTLDDVYQVESNNIVINKETAKELGIDPKCFETLGTIHLVEDK